MPVSRSKINSQGRVSVTARRVGTFSSDDIHRALFPDKPPKPHTLEELKRGLRQHARDKYAALSRRTVQLARKAGCPPLDTF